METNLIHVATNYIHTTLPTIFKIFERQINRHLMSYLNKYCLIHETQSGFRQKHSCQTALMKLIDQWMTCIDKVDIVGSIFIDFRKAFDLVDHKTLIRKLSTYKCSQSSPQWFTSYLKSHQQTIDYGHGTSLLSFYWPQGSILEPLVFLLFINDLPLFLKHCFSDFFADISTIHSSAPSIAKVNMELQADLEITVAWSKQKKNTNQL